jgi:hypothetical protein
MNIPDTYLARNIKCHRAGEVVAEVSDDGEFLHVDLGTDPYLDVSSALALAKALQEVANGVIEQHREVGGKGGGPGQ